MRTHTDRRYSRRTRAFGASTAAVVALGAAGALALNATSASAELTPMSADELLVSMHDAERSPLAGTVELQADLGLPDVRGLGGGSADPTALLAGTHTVRVWKGEHAQSRVDLLGDARETRVTLNGSDLWTWTSDTKEARHYILPNHTDMPEKHAKHGEKGADREAMMRKHHGDGDKVGQAPATPEEAADRVLDAVGETTAVTTENTRVAGRDAYSLVLTPKAEGTLVDRIEVAVDGERKVPLRVQVFSKKISNPAYSVGFTKVDFSAPDESVFEFTPPSGANVTTTDVAAQMKQGQAKHGSKGEKSAAEHKAAKNKTDKKGDNNKARGERVTGEGWARVYVTAPPKGEKRNAADVLLEGLNQSENSDAGTRTVTRLIEALPKQSGDWGSGTVFEGTLFTLVLADDGRVGFGAVPANSVFSALSAK